MKRIRRIDFFIFLLSFIFIIMLAFSGCNKAEIKTKGLNENEAEENIKRQEGIVGDKMPIKRSAVAKMLAYYFYKENEINSLDRVIEFEDVKEGQWFDKYVNAVFKGGYMFGKNEKNFMPDNFLSLEEAQSLVDRMNKNNKIKIKLTEENKNKPISMALWNELFIKALEERGYGEIKKEEVIFIADNKENKEISEGYAITDNGLHKIEGISCEDLIGVKAEILKKDNNILAINKIMDIEPTLENALVCDKTDNAISFFIGGIKKEIKMYNKDLFNDVNKGDICDIKIKNKFEIEKIDKLDNKINSKIRLMDDDKLELEVGGEIYKTKNFRIYYFDENKVSLKSDSALISGQVYTFFIKEGKVCAAIIDNKNEKNTDKIRVLINNNENKNVNGMVKISCDSYFFVITGKDKRSYKAKEEVCLEKGKNEDLFSKDTILVKAENEDSFINISSIKNKNNEILRLKGDVEIKKENDGYVIVNETDIESYTQGVLSGIAENLTKENGSIEEESLKMLAVVVRSKAFSQREENALLNLGANVDRTEKYQLFYPSNINENVKKACEETKNICVSYEGEKVKLNYFGYDCGLTASLGEVWFDKESFSYPFESEGYNKGRQLIKGNFGQLKEEENFRKFIDTGESEFDNPWFRWSFKMNKAELEACVNTSIKYLYKDYPRFIKCLDKSGKFISKPVETVGEIKNIEVTKRGENGNVMEIKITGSKEIVILSTDNVIRKIIKPKQFIYGRNSIEVTKFDGSKVEDLNIIPSSFYYLNVAKNDSGELMDIEVKGGGYGHGVGISLKRSDYYAKEGMSYKEIIKSFYSGVSVG